MKTIALFCSISFLLLLGCTSSAGIPDAVRQCGPGEDLEILAGLADPQETRAQGRIVFVVEVANNSDHDVTVESVAVNPRRDESRPARHTPPPVAKTFHQLIEDGDDHRFELPSTSFTNFSDPFEEIYEGASALEFLVSVRLRGGETYHCSFAAGQR